MRFIPFVGGVYRATPPTAGIQWVNHRRSGAEGRSLKGEIVPIDTALFRYAYRMRVQGDKAVILDLHNADYYYHVFTYPDF